MNLGMLANYGAMAIDWDSISQDVINAIFVTIVVLIILLVGYIVGYLAKKGTEYILRRTVDPAMSNTSIGETLQKSKVDLSSFIGTLVLVFVMTIAFIAAVDYMNMGGQAGDILYQVALYLPKLIGGIIVLTVGIILAALLAKYIEILLDGAFEEKYTVLSSLIANLILIGLVAFVVTLGLNIMELKGDMLYPLILGSVIIGAGAIIGSALVDHITEEHRNFKEAAPYAKFVIYLLFATVGAAAMFSGYPDTLAVLQTLSWGLAIAMGLVMVAFLVKIVKDVWKEEE
jgi:hypothetical protein